VVTDLQSASNTDKSDGVFFIKKKKKREIQEAAFRFAVFSIIFIVPWQAGTTPKPQIV